VPRKGCAAAPAIHVVTLGPLCDLSWHKAAPTGASVAIQSSQLIQLATANASPGAAPNFATSGGWSELAGPFGHLHRAL
jgi:hypothetical protein